MLRSLFGDDIIVVGPDIYPALAIAIDHPHEIGADLIANAVAVMNRYHENCVVVDFGTALTFTTVSKDREILGVAIVPGLVTAVKALFANTAHFPKYRWNFLLLPSGKTQRRPFRRVFYWDMKVW
jgi:type III pantothenate kinase